MTTRKTFVHTPVSLGYDDLGDASVPGTRLYVTPQGNTYPSITTVLSVRGKEAIYEWRRRVGEEEANRVTRHACARGTAMHTIAEKYLNNEPDIYNKDEMPHVVALFRSIQPVLDNNIGRVVMQECPLYSDHLGIAGRVDLVAEYEGKLSIIDFKTSKRVKTRDEISNYFIQLCAYSIMFEERTGIPVPRTVIIMAVDDSSTPVVFKEKRDSWTSELQKVIKEYNTKKLFGHA
jgi:CRISPR/Cas system-associated exonuclease Cas4 (RecB family)